MLGICSQSGTYVHIICVLQLSIEAIKEGADSKLQCSSAALKKTLPGLGDEAKAGHPFRIILRAEPLWPEARGRSDLSMNRGLDSFFFMEHQEKMKNDSR